MSTIEDATTASTALVTFDDGTTLTLDISKPLYALQASKLPAENEIEQSFNLLWVAAGKPHENLEAWLANVKSVDVADVDPTIDPPTE